MFMQVLERKQKSIHICIFNKSRFAIKNSKKSLECFKSMGCVVKVIYLALPPCLLHPSCSLNYFEKVFHPTRLIELLAHYLDNTEYVTEDNTVFWLPFKHFSENLHVLYKQFSNSGSKSKVAPPIYLLIFEDTKSIVNTKVTQYE